MTGSGTHSQGGEAAQGRRPRLQDVADRAGVHISTASRALDDTKTWRLSEETIQRVREAARELAYEPDLIAFSLKSGQTKSVGVVVADLDNPYNAALIRGIARALEESDFVPLVAETVENRARFERLLRHFMRRRVDAIITAATHLGDAELLEEVVGDAIPVVLAVRSLPGSRYAAVVHDDHNGGALAAEHLAELGHTAVAQLTGPTDIDTFARRTQGFREAAAAHSLDDLTLPASAHAPTLAEGRRLMSMVLEHEPRPTGIFAPTDVMAVGAFDAIGRAGLSCPDDISVIGYNDVPLGSHLDPPLTTVRLPSEELGRRAGRAALDLIADPTSIPATTQLPATLVRRASAGPAPKR